MHDDDLSLAVPVRMGILLRRAAVRSPSGVADAVESLHRIRAYNFLEIPQLTRSAPHQQFRTAVHHSNPGRVISPIFQPAQAVQYDRDSVTVPDVPYNSTHSSYIVRAFALGGDKKERMSKQLSGKSALVTGASRGIGAAAAIA